MTEKLPSLSETLRMVAGEDPAEHPSLDRLLAYHHAELEDPQRDSVQEHLARCEECVRMLLDLGEPGRAPRHPGMEAAWPSLRGRIAEAARQRQPSPAIRPRRPPPGGIAYAIAAALLLACVGLGLSHQRLEHRFAEARRQLEALSQPQLQLPMADLYPVGFARSGEEGETVLRVPPGVQLFTLTLNLSTRNEDRTYALEILDAEGREIWRHGPLEPTPYGNFFIALRRGFLPPGRFELRIYDAGDSARTPIARYRLRLDYE